VGKPGLGNVPNGPNGGPYSVARSSTSSAVGSPAALIAPLFLELLHIQPLLLMNENGGMIVPPIPLSRSVADPHLTDSGGDTVGVPGEFR